MNSPDESLLLRWSRRKQEARQQKEAEKAVGSEVSPEVPSVTGQPPEPVQQMSDSAVISESETDESAADTVDIANLPDVESLTYESDFTAFLREGVPDQLKQAALRKLWTSDPVLANLDGLNDYDPKTMTFLQQLEGTAEPVAEVGRSLRDKIMEAKRAREDRPRGPRRRRADRQVADQRAQDAATPVRVAAAEDDNSDVGNGDIAAPDVRRDN